MNLHLSAIKELHKPSSSQHVYRSYMDYMVMKCPFHPIPSLPSAIGWFMTLVLRRKKPCLEPRHRAGKKLRQVSDKSVLMRLARGEYLKAFMSFEKRVAAPRGGNLGKESQSTKDWDVIPTKCFCFWEYIRCQH